MGRGRQRAKNAKIARDLKYFSPDTNYQALEQELASKSDVATDTRKHDTADDDDDEWSGWPESR
ncbi:MAG: DUF3073 domain-containing protein [Actinomycetota bacterium]|nr:DUF3073 domain-containing protein [Actinomycetota bacterium]